MPDLLDTSSAWLEGKREQFMSRSVIYKRGETTVQVPATIGQTIFQLDDGAGGVLRTDARDYLIRTAHLILAGNPTLPERGDQIHEMADGGDVIVSVINERGEESNVQFCAGAGGGKSKRTRLTLIELARAIEQDNAEVPFRDPKNLERASEQPQHKKGG